MEHKKKEKSYIIIIAIIIALISMILYYLIWYQWTGWEEFKPFTSNTQSSETASWVPSGKNDASKLRFKNCEFNLDCPSVGNFSLDVTKNLNVAAQSLSGINATSLTLDGIYPKPGGGSETIKTLNYISFPIPGLTTPSSWNKLSPTKQNALTTNSTVTLSGKYKTL